MAFQFGRNTVVGIAKEAAYNESYALPTFKLDIDSLSFKPMQEPIEANFASGTAMPKLTQFARGRKSVSGTLVMSLWKEQLGIILQNIFGTVTAADQVGAGSFYRHIFTVSNTTPASVRMVVQQANQEWRLTGVQFTRLELNFPPELGEIKMTLNFTGANYTTNAVTGAPTANPTAAGVQPKYYYHEGNWSINALTAWAGVTFVMELSYADSPEESYQGGSKLRQRLERAASGNPPVQILLTAQRVHNDMNAYELWEADPTDTTFESTFVIGQEDPTEDYHFAIRMGKCKAVEWDAVQRETGIQDDRIIVKPYIDAGTFYSTPSTDFKIVLQDKQAAIPS